MKRLGSRGVKGTGKASRPDANRENEMMDDALVEITADELREFLEADTLDVRADPAFKERLRRQLWEIVRSKLPTEPPEGDGSN